MQVVHEEAGLCPPPDAGSSPQVVHRPLEQGGVARRMRGEALALIRKALREKPGLSATEVSLATGIERVLAGVLLANYRSAGHVESIGPKRSLRWYIAGMAPGVRESRQVQTRQGSVFALHTPAASDAMAPPRSRVISPEVAAACYVAPDDFSAGAFMADWKRRTS